MAAASYNTDLTDLVADSATTANWAALGGGASGLNIETDYFIEGTRCVSKNAFANSTKGMVEDTTATTLSTGSGNAVYLWVTHATPGSLDLKANGGITICLGSSSAALNRYFYAGTDTIDYGAPWICAVVNPDDATANSGTVAVTAMDTYGAEAAMVGGPTKGSPFGIDEIRYGHSISINDGAGAPANFTALAVQNDSQNNRWGQFQRTPGSSTNFTMQCRIEYGDTIACVFDDSNKNITIPDLEFVASTFVEFDVTTSSTVSWTNINVTASAGANTRGRWVSTSTTSVALTTSSFTNFGTLGFDSNTTSTGCTYRGCDTITQNGSTITGGIVDSSTNAVALVADDVTLVTKVSFISDGTGHAVNIGTIAATTSIAWDNSLTSSTTEWDGSVGDTVGVSGTANDAILVSVSSGQTLTLSVATGASIPTVRNTGPGTVSIVAGQVTTTITVQDGSVSPPVTITDLTVNLLLEAAAGGPLTVGTDIIKGFTNASGQASDIRSLASDQPVAGWARRASAGNSALPSGTKYFKETKITGTISSTTGLSLTVLLQKDE